MEFFSIHNPQSAIHNHTPARLPDFTRARVVVVGDVMLDCYTWGDVSRISPEAPVPVLHCREQTRALGGAGNVAANLAGLGASVQLCGLRGQDASGLCLQQLLNEQGIVDLGFVQPAFATITKTRIMARQQQLLRIDEEQPAAVSDALADRLLDAVQSAIRPDCVVVLSDYGKGLLTPKVCQGIIQCCRSRGVMVLVDPKGLDWAKYQGAQCVTPNIMEFEAVSRIDSRQTNAFFSEAAAVVEQLELDALLVTRGRQGMVLFQGGVEPVNIPARTREVFDVSGAGDTVVATLAGCLAAGCSWKQGAEIANLAAGIVVGKLGTRPVHRDELEHVLSEVVWGPPKVFSARAGLETIQRWRQQEQRIVFTNGCFDILHPGHVKLLQAAAAQGDRLVVGLNSDDSVSRLKGPRRPILRQDDRAAILSALECVDLVIVFAEDTPLQLLESIKPDVLVKGGDYADKIVVGREFVEAYGGRVVLVDLEAGLSTSNLVESLLKNAHST